MTEGYLAGWNRSRLTGWLSRSLPYRFPLLIIFQLGLLALSYIGSYYLRFEGLIPRAEYRTMIKTLPIVLSVQGLLFLYHNFFQGLWRYVSFPDLKNILRATSLSLVVLIILDFFLNP